MDSNPYQAPLIPGDPPPDALSPAARRWSFVVLGIVTLMVFTLPFSAAVFGPRPIWWLLVGILPVGVLGLAAIGYGLRPTDLRRRAMLVVVTLIVVEAVLAAILA